MVSLQHHRETWCRLRHIFAVAALVIVVDITGACEAGNKEVGVCLHVYLERDFLSLQSIVYPYTRSSYLTRNAADSGSYNEYNVTGVSGGRLRGWMEGPMLTRDCERLKGVVSCFEEVLVSCDSANKFFRYRRLLHSLDLVHSFLCATALTRRQRFNEFLRTIDCAEKARQEMPSQSCHRHNVTTNIWNKILRLEIGSEICDSLTTQRSCLLENGYLKRFCKAPNRVKIYTQVSGLFLSTWCQVHHLPGVPKIPRMLVAEEPDIEGSSSGRVSVFCPTALLLAIVTSTFLI